MNLKKKVESYLRVNLLGPGPRLVKKRICRAAVSQRLRNTALECNISQVILPGHRHMIFGTEFGCVFLYWHLICKLIANSDIWTGHYLKDFMVLLDFECFSMPLCYIPHHPCVLFVGPRFCRLFQ